MPATLNVSFSSADTAWSAFNATVQASVQRAFSAWLSHFDVSTGALTLSVTFASLGPGEAASCGPVANTVVGTSAGSTVLLSSFGSELAYGVAQGSTAATLNIDTTWLQNTFPGGSLVSATGDDQRVFEHELGHALGILGQTVAATRTAPAYESSYSRYIQTTTTGTGAAFVGPNAESSYGGPVALEAAQDHPYVGGKVSVMSYLNPATSIQTLDVDLLRDSGLPVLTDREVAEHEIVRLYGAAFNRNSDLAGLEGWTNQLLAGTSLHDVATGFLNSPEFAARYGSNSSAKTLVDALYTQALHRAPDAAGEAYWVNMLNGGWSRAELVIDFSESTENRQALAATTNTSYAGTVEEEVARLYATAFLRNADPAGFSSWTTALLNGTTVGQVAAQFVTSAEFIADYGAGQGNAAFVTSLYQNALGRAPDAAGLASWVASLNSGLARSDLLVTFSDSAEHVARMAATAVVGSSGSMANLVDTPLGLIPTHTSGTLVG